MGGRAAAGRRSRAGRAGPHPAAFTGVTAAQTGYLDLADGGTLILDEVGAMPAPVQPKLLRVLDDGRSRPQGARRGHELDVRVVAATNQPVQAIREDLFCRLARFTVELPPPRERSGDIPLLAQHVLGVLAEEMGGAVPALTDAARERLLAQAHPGNVRELKNVVKRALVECAGGDIEPTHLHVHGMRGDGLAVGAAPLGIDALPVELARTERLLLERAVEQAGGTISQAARALGIDRN